MPSITYLQPIPVVYRTGISRVARESVNRDYDSYHLTSNDLNQLTGEAAADEKSVKELLEQLFLRSQVLDSADWMKKMLATAQQLILMVGCTVHFTKKSHAEPLKDLESDLWTVRRGAEARAQI